jgi:hypothetical protein
MSGHDAEVPPVADAAGRLRALGATVAEARRRLAEGAGFDVASLRGLATEVLAALPPGKAASGVDAGLLALLDEATELVSRLGLEHGSLREQAWAWARGRRAKVSYVSAGRGR